MAKANKELHEMAAFVHGALCSLHTLGIIYNIRRKNWLDVAAHSMSIAYSARSTAHHLKLIHPVQTQDVQ